jgi:putative redox protein
VAGANPSIVLDYTPPLGDGQGYLSLELLLLSLAVCSSSTIVPILRKMRKTVAGFAVKAKGIRREQHPTAFEKIWLEFDLQSPDADETSLQKAIKLSEDTYCPVWAMLRNNVEIITAYQIHPFESRRDGMFVAQETNG